MALVKKDERVFKSDSASKLFTFALVGNPNSGKTTLFNALTGLRQKIANYPGVTIEKKVGIFYTLYGEKCQLIDLPGTYSLLPNSPDEKITTEVLLGLREDTPKPDGIICIVDASNLERSLYLVSQILELDRPVVIVLNMIDELAAKGWEVDCRVLSQKFNCPVVPCQANKKNGIVQLKTVLSKEIARSKPFVLNYPDFIQEEITTLENQSEIQGIGPISKIMLLLLLLSPDPETTAKLFRMDFLIQPVKRAQEKIGKLKPNWRDAVVRERFLTLQHLVKGAVKKGVHLSRGLSDMIDRYVAHPFWGWLIFSMAMALMFLAVFGMGSYPKDLIDAGMRAISEKFQAVFPPGELRDLISQGIIGGAGNVVVFLPQILVLFFFIGLLEDTGYMARAAFLMDKLMNAVGLHGKSFLPLLSSHACAIPGILAARTIDNPKDRLLTILIAPFASCSARLPVYVLMCGVLFSQHSHPVLWSSFTIFFLYILGIGGAFFFAWIFKKTLFKGKQSFLLLELPPYRRPSIKSIGLQMYERALAFLKRAGTIIVSVSILLWFLTSHPKFPGESSSQALSHSFAGRIGHFLEPVIKPLGFNWKIGVGLLSAQAAREMFVSTMGVIYTGEETKENILPLAQAMRKDKWPDGKEVFSPLTCFSLMIYFAFSLQCLSTVAVVRRETGSWKWALFQFAYMTSFAYFCAFLFYQIGLLLGFS
ncbi:iron transporter [Methylacidiphilum kamchatkense Kam1]|uniref:Ferrous iron transport protein B n=1 Tax=Methylacidiphilum kamchatkense Kam1 TaxID=1202785 RepID=A0A0C1RJR6_9BACT|nr:ferrous iron transport protein B [Methylacidiphilum kamchatkense]KIE58302.1 iron transporter [Methylacidiphilum kamchatkense Kam1]QDQ42297.1 ferrous iron transport protein B [Methylacidiphilum kamchatkense Kam1]